MATTINVADKTTLDAVYELLKNANVADKTTLDAVHALLQTPSGAIKSVQRGCGTISNVTGTSSDNINHSAVNLNKSFIILNSSAWYNGVPFPCMVASRTTTSFKIATCGSNGTVSAYCSWQLIEFY